MRRTILFLVVFALVLASCGGGTEEARPSGTRTPDATASATAAGSPTASPTPGYRLDYDFPPWDRAVKLFDYDASEPLGYEVLAEDRQEGATVYDIEYQSTGYAVPAYLVIPDGQGPFPVVLWAHGSNSERGWFLNDAVALAQDGYSGLMITSPASREPYLCIGISCNARQDVKGRVQYTVDLRRGLDLLETLPEIDAKRIGFVGYSLGAWAGSYLAGVEDRIDAYVLQSVNGWPCADVAGSGTTCHVLDLYGFRNLPQSQQKLEHYLSDIMVLNPVPYVAHSEGAAFLFQASKADKFESVPTIRAVFEAAPESKTFKWYEGGHLLGCAYMSCYADIDAYVDHRGWLQENV